MAEIRTLNAHDPVPTGGRNVVVLRRFDEDEPRKTIIQIFLTHRHGAPEAARPALSMDEVIAAARRVADEEGIAEVLVIDRTAGPRERDILNHGGDHSVHMGQLDDFDTEDGERGPDMQDRT
jgi:hypothetical protein